MFKQTGLIYIFKSSLCTEQTGVGQADATESCAGVWTCRAGEKWMQLGRVWVESKDSRASRESPAHAALPSRGLPSPPRHTHHSWKNFFAGLGIARSNLGYPGLHFKAP